MQSRVIGVLGASGGVGASALAAGLAVRADAAGWATACVDGDRYGGGLDVMLGLDLAPGLRWPDLVSVDGEVDGAKLAAELPWCEDIAVLSFDRDRCADPSVEPVEQVLGALARSHDVVVVDLPPLGDELFGTFAQRCTDLVLLAGTRVTELAAAAAVEPLVSAFPARCWLAVRSGTGRRAPGCEDAAETMSRALGLSLVTMVPEDRGLDADVAQGIPPAEGGRGGFTRAVDAVLAEVLAGVPAPGRRSA